MRGRLGTVLKSTGVGLLQFLLILILTLLSSFAVDMNAGDNAIGVAAILGLTSLVGTTVGGWLGLRLAWLSGGSRYPARIFASAVGIIAVLGLGFLLGQIREASPFLTGGMIAGIVGFQAVGWFGVRDSGQPG